jgi:hypothetical protein
MPQVFHSHPGFRHRDLIVYAVQYELATFPRSFLIVWLDERGNSLEPWVRPADPRKPMVTVKPGDQIIHNGGKRKVVEVSIYRALGVDGGREIAG